ncbi:GyrI-like domain-containing protein [Plantactinospora sp. CA-294935]|uniref:GyrI-like domain-containing protein n=1 Tax=Plantactinospora sp. CA-294935 TaxID=3240012 RepID=UPI003D94382D
MTTTPRTDLKKTYSHLYAAVPAPALVDVPELPYLTIDGVGDPDGPAYQEAVRALYAVAYGLRFGLRRAGVLDYSVAPLEGLWWGSEEQDLTRQDRSTWNWTMMILQPPQAGAELVAGVVAATARKKPGVPVDRVELRRMAEGPSAQLLHVGPYREERATRDRLVAFLDRSGYRISGQHHEIYLSDPTRTAAAKLRTILRYPVAPATT